MTSLTTRNVSSLALQDLDDAELALYVEGLAQQRKEIAEDIKRVEDAGREELKRRMIERNARAIADPRFEKIALEEVYSPYTYDLTRLHEAKLYLPEDEGAKILKHIPEQVTIIPEHYEPGAAVSISALIRKYGEESQVGKILSQAMTRQKLDEKVVIKLAKGHA